MKVVIEGHQMSYDLLQEIARKLDIDPNENVYVKFSHLIIEVLE